MNKQTRIYSNYDTYKDSGVDWIGKLPNKWNVKPLKSLFMEKSEKGYPELQLLSVYRDFGVVPTDSRDDNHNVPSEDLSGYKKVNAGNLVTNKMKAWQGSICISDYDGIVSPAYFVYKRIENKNNSRYLHYLLRSSLYISLYKANSIGIRPGQWDLEKKFFERISVIIPELDSQRRISEFLDIKLNIIDCLIEKNQNLIALLQEKRQAMITHAVTKGLDPKVKMKDSGVEWIGEILTHWNMSYLKYIAYINDGNHGEQYPNQDDYVNSDEGVPFIRGGNLKRGEISNIDMLYISRKKNSSMRKGRLNKSDILFVNRGDIGLSAYVRDNHQGSNLNSQIAYLRILKGIPRYYYYFTNTTVIENIVASSREGSTLIQFPLEDIKNIKTFRPPLGEQQQISEYLDKVYSITNEATDKVELQIIRLKEYKSALIYIMP